MQRWAASIGEITQNIGEITQSIGEITQSYKTNCVDPQLGWIEPKVNGFV